MDLCNSLNLLQIVTSPTRTNDTSMTLTEVVLTTNKSFIADYNVNISAVANHCLVAVRLKLKAPSLGLLIFSPEATKTTILSHY